MIQITNKVDCCGCNACGDACNHDAISFQTDIEGFWYPVVDKEKCVDCGLCEKVCPIINVKDLKKNDLPQSECYALQHKNLESLFDSTSGAAFPALAEAMYREGGYVGGAIYNDDFSVSQLISSKKSDLEKLRNSKYVQSDAQGFYKAIREILRDGNNKVLVCGLPCQMAALRAFLKRDYDNLIIVDLICRGINSPKLLKGYVKYLENCYSSKIVYFKTKNKELGWRRLATKVVFENGKVLYDTSDRSYFTVGYLQTNVFCRPSCYECKFKGYPRIADITIADFWGVEKILGENWDHDLGTSLVMLNSIKGKNYFEKVERKVKIKNVPFDLATSGNPALLHSLPLPVIDRNQFYKDLNNYSFKEVAEKYIKLPSKRSLSIKDKLKNIIRFAFSMRKCCGLNLSLLIKNLYYNMFKPQVHGSILEGRFLVIHKYCVLDIAQSATLELGGIMSLGCKRICGSKLESRFLIDTQGKLTTQGNVFISYGADIEVFQGAKLTIGANFVSNINAVIICGNQIIIEDNVNLGRNVTIRDNNGEHYISRRTYKASRPIHIGEHSWLCEEALIMPGTRLGTGVIVAARSLVSGRFDNFTMLSGSPAEVVDKDVFVKM